MKHLINERSNIVTESIEGLLAGASGHALARLDGFPHIKVVLRRNWNRQQVALISGGGSGHEPAHAGYVGEGMLTAAVCGEVFASPSVDAVLAAILAVTGPAGCLLIVKNYTGDRLNFGLAAEKAKAMGYKVEMLVVSDDVALPDAAQPRGIAGTILVHKIAGYFAESGHSLQEVVEIASRAAASICSLGLAVSNCAVPGQPATDRMGDDQAELGLGIHGEPGKETISMAAVNDLADQVCHSLTTAARRLPGKRQALLINNLGGLTDIEMNLLTRHVMQTGLADKVELIAGPARIMTALEMRGFSLSLMEVDEPLIRALLHPVQPWAWLPVQARQESHIAALPGLPETARPKPSRHATHRNMLEKACQALVAAESRLNDLDSRIGDGDTGSTFATAANSILEELDKLPLAEPVALLSSLGDLLAKSMGGSSGVLASIFFTRASLSLDKNGSFTEAWVAGCEGIQAYGGAKLGDRTLLDALIPALAELSRNKPLADAAEAAANGAANTAQMQSARAGRASYVSGTHLQGIEDPGARAIALVFAAIAAP